MILFYVIMVEEEELSMYKNKINYLFVNIVFVLLIIYLLYITFGLWNGIVSTFIKIVAPFVIAFTIAYALYPFVKKLQSKNIPKGLAIAIVILLVLGFVALIIWLVVPVVIKQLIAFSNWILEFVKSISTQYNVDLGNLQEYVGDLKSIVSSFGKSIGDFSLVVINKSINIATLTIIALISSIYFLSSMDKYRKHIKKYLKRKNNRAFNYVKKLDYEVSRYFNGLEKYMFVQFIEYTLVFFLIGHPYYILLGILCSVTTIIPYFGGIFSNIIACITAFFISTKLFILTLIVSFICPNIDGYIISPRIYGKTNNVPALLTIFAAFAGGKLFGIIGIVIALPMTIVLLATYNFYEDEINQKIEDIKNKM